MTDSLRAVLAELAQATNPFVVAGSPFRHAHRFSDPATHEEVVRAWSGQSLPVEVLSLWAEAREIELFMDIDFGQWGLRLLSPGTSAARTEAERLARRTDIEDGDIVLGEFIGDLELLTIDRLGAVLIALPLDPRTHWSRAADDLTSFLVHYSAAHGEKYWESDPNPNIGQGTGPRCSEGFVQREV